MNPQKNQGGFTLIETMIVVSIIGILASLALASYSNYTIKAEVAEGLELASKVTNNVVEYYHDHGVFPSDNQASGLDAPTALTGNYVESVQVENGAIHITYGNQVHNIANGKQLTLRPLQPSSSSSHIQWICGNNDIPSGRIAMGTNRTTLNGSYLTIACR